MIRVNQLSKTYSRRDRQVLRDVSFTLPDTGFVCIVGASGCGKTSLLNAIGGLDVFDGGSVSTDTLPRLRCGSRRRSATAASAIFSRTTTCSPSTAWLTTSIWACTPWT